MTDDTLTVLDYGTPLAISFDDCVRYHGRTSIGGVALGFRLIQRALADLAPDGPPERDAIAVRTAFPGPGLRDAVEMTTRAVTRGAYTVDESLAAPTAPEAVAGRLWFEVTIGDRRRAYAAVPGAMSDEFVRVGRAARAGTLDAAGLARWTELKETLARTIMDLRPQDVLAGA